MLAPSNRGGHPGQTGSLEAVSVGRVTGHWTRFSTSLYGAYPALESHCKAFHLVVRRTIHPNTSTDREGGHLRHQTPRKDMIFCTPSISSRFYANSDSLHGFFLLFLSCQL